MANAQFCWVVPIKIRIFQTILFMGLLREDKNKIGFFDTRCNQPNATNIPLADASQSASTQFSLTNFCPQTWALPVEPTIIQTSGKQSCALDLHFEKSSRCHPAAQSQTQDAAEANVYYAGTALSSFFSIWVSLILQKFVRQFFKEWKRERDEWVSTVFPPFKSSPHCWIPGFVAVLAVMVVALLSRYQNCIFATLLA